MKNLYEAEELISLIEYILTHHYLDKDKFFTFIKDELKQQKGCDCSRNESCQNCLL